MYDLLMIDPPWPIRKVPRKVGPNQTPDLDYSTILSLCWTARSNLAEAAAEGPPIEGEPSVSHVACTIICYQL